MCSGARSSFRLYCKDSCTTWVVGAVLYEWQQLPKSFASDAAYIYILCQNNTKDTLPAATKTEILVV